jgi:hypothetical protein
MLHCYFGAFSFLAGDHLHEGVAFVSVDDAGLDAAMLSEDST